MMSYSEKPTSAEESFVYSPTPVVTDVSQVFAAPCNLMVCENGGTCMEGVCHCPIRYDGVICQDDVLVRFISIGCLIGAVLICFTAIIYQRVQERYTEHTPVPRRILSVRNRNLSRTDRTTALAYVEAPPDYEDAMKCEKDENKNRSRSSKHSEIRTKSESLDKRSKCLNSSDGATSSQEDSSRDRVKPSLSFASRLLERALVSKRPRTAQISEDHAVRNNSARRSNSAPSLTARENTGRRSSPQNEQVRSKIIQGPTRAISVPGKVVQVTME